MSEDNAINKSQGQIQIADDVLAIIAATAASEVTGVRTIAQVATDSIAGFFHKKNQSKGVKIEFDGADANIDIEIAVAFGTRIHVAAQEVQLKIKSAIETMTGIKVSEVNVSVSAVVLETPASDNIQE